MLIAGMAYSIGYRVVWVVPGWAAGTYTYTHIHTHIHTHPYTHTHTHIQSGWYLVGLRALVAVLVHIHAKKDHILPVDLLEQYEALRTTGQLRRIVFVLVPSKRRYV
jgi:hypothetical protein